MIAERYKYFLMACVIIPLMLIINGCKERDNDNPIPNVHVNINLDINSTLYSNLSIIGGHEYITGGYKGIIVYRASQYDFMAYDRACPYDHQIDDARLDVEDNGMTVIDSTCMSRFLLLDGSVVDGPATRPLKAYRTNFDGEYLFIYN